MSKIEYLYNTLRVRQTIGTICRYELEGVFDKVVSKIMEEHVYYIKFTETPHEIVERSGYGRKLYLDGTDTKSVKFDTLHLDWRDTYDNEKELCVIGERAMDASEIAAYTAELEAHKHREIDQLKKLKEKYPDV